MRKAKWQAKEVATIGPEGGVLPVDISLSADDKTLSSIASRDGKVRVFDVSDPTSPSPFNEKVIGKQLNMVSQSWDGKRSTSAARCWRVGTNWGADNDQFVRAYHWNGAELKPAFQLDFKTLKLGRPHHMLFGSTKVGS
jgi:selenium-binding protein 1